MKLDQAILGHRLLGVARLAVLLVAVVAVGVAL